MNATHLTLSTWRLWTLFFGLGSFSQIAQALLAREFLVVFHGNEISIGAFYGGWLLWIAIGAHQATQRLRATLSPAAMLIPVLMLPLILGGEMVAIRLVRHLWDPPVGAILPMGSLMLAAVLLTAPIGWILGYLFPMACQGMQATGLVTRLYLYEALGALAGALLFVFGLVERLEAVAILGVTTTAMAASTWLIPASIPWRISGLILALTGVLLAFSPWNTPLTKTLEQWRFQGLHPGLTLITTLETRYGHTALATRGDQTSVIHDGLLTTTFPNPMRTAIETALLHAQAHSPRHILLFGTMADGLAGELLRYPGVERITLLEEDRLAHERILAHLPPAMRTPLDDPRLKIHFGDGRAWMQQLPAEERFDLILVWNGEPSSTRMNRFFTKEFHTRLARQLTPNGAVCTRVSSAANYLGQEVGSYGGVMWHTLRAVHARLIAIPGDPLIFCGSSDSGNVTDDPEQLMERYRSTHPNDHALPEQIFLHHLPPDRTAQTRQRLQQEHVTHNTDLQPVTFFYNMVLWSKYSNSEMGTWLVALQRLGMWPYLTPMAIALLFWLISRPLATGQATMNPMRWGAALILMIVGWIAMAWQLMILLAFQARVGHLFGHLALLNGVFMAGLALGALWGERHTTHHARTLALLMILLAGAIWFFPDVTASSRHLGSEAATGLHVLLAILNGGLAGTAFPLSLRLTASSGLDVASRGGLAESADHLGGALGALLAGGLLVPMLGMTGSSQLLAWLALFTLPLLLTWNRTWRWPRWITTRFANSGSSVLPWLTAWAVLVALILGSVARPEPPQPQTRFDDTTLAQVSGSERFVTQTSPVPHHLGSGTTQPPTITLASASVAPEVKGFAGPLNLLVSLDATGTLRGVRLIASRETPSYIQGIEAWLYRLHGLELPRIPLTMPPLDGLSGATITSQAALETIRRTVHAATSLAHFSWSLAPIHTTQTPPWYQHPAPWLTLGLLLLATLLHRQNRPRARLGMLLLTLLDPRSPLQQRLDRTGSGPSRLGSLSPIRGATRDLDPAGRGHSGRFGLGTVPLLLALPVRGLARVDFMDRATTRLARFPTPRLPSTRPSRTFFPAGCNRRSGLGHRQSRMERVQSHAGFLCQSVEPMAAGSGGPVSGGVAVLLPVLVSIWLPSGHPARLVQQNRTAGPSGPATAFQPVRPARPPPL
ncbi:MAG: FMN-binding protein [Magnetococcales bacterium]|nr:FMN-binding protein [Magnetococcales bacterium]